MIIILRSSCTFSFKSSCTFFLNIFQRQLDIFLRSFRSRRTFLKKHEIFPEAATHLLNHKKYVQKQLHKFSRLLHKICTPCAKIFKSLSKLRKTSLMVIKPKALHVPWPIFVIPSACTSLLSSSLFRAILCLLTVYTLCFFFSNKIYSLYIVSPSNMQVL